MKSDKILVFDLMGEYGHFRKFNTTTSPLTYPMPPRPALSGIIGAILGIERETSPGKFPPGVVPLNELFQPEKLSVAVQLLRPVKKTRMAFNLLDTSKSASSFFNIANRTQIEFEILKDPAFRIFMQHADLQIFNDLAERMRLRRYHFTPYLGISQFAATTDYHGIFSCKIVQNTDNKSVEIKTAVNMTELVGNRGDAISFEKGLHYSVDTYPRVMQPDREISQYSEILVELSQGKEGRFWVNCTELIQVENFGNILFL